MTIDCPSCRHSLSIKDPIPGRFRISCPECRCRFSLTVPKVGSDAGPKVELLEPSSEVRTSGPRVPVVGRSVTDESPDVDPTASMEIPRILAAEFPTPPPENDDTIEDQRRKLESLDPPIQPPRTLAGYRVGRRVGVIRLGTLFEAVRMATGRAVALEVVKPRWSADPRFVSRFAREAYAAGQLTHPNLITPLDFDIAQGFPIVVSEALAGAPLSDPLGREGLNRTARVAAILHVARALKHAHEQGIYHRNLSLGKIRVDGSGLVRLADLGSGLTPETSEVPAIEGVSPVAVAGLPPAPTPTEPPTAIFIREDIAELGRSLQALLGGTQGERGATPGLATITRKMLSDEPGERYADLGAVVRTLEAELGLVAAFAPKDEEAAEFEACARAFEEPPMARVRPKLILGSLAAVALFVGVALLTRKPLLAMGALGFTAIVATALMVLRGTFGREPLFDRVRELFFGGGRGDALTAVVSLALVVVVLYASGLLGFWVFLTALAFSLSMAYHFAINRQIETARARTIERATNLIRGFRRLGVSEESVRRAACQHLGPRWEEFYEALFGYEALRQARTRWGLDAGGRPRPRFARWRDPIIDAIDARVEARLRARDRVLFSAIEERALEAGGINLMTARRKGRRVAEAIVLYAHRFRREGEAATGGFPLMDALNRVAQRPEDYLSTVEADPETDDSAGPPAWRESLGFVARVLFGPRTRFLMGVGLLAGFLLWMSQNDLADAQRIKDAGIAAPSDPGKAVENAGTIGHETLANVKNVLNAEKVTRPLEISWLPPALARRLDGFGLGVGGLILVLSSAFRGVRFGAFAIPGAIVAVLGPQWIEAGARPLGPSSLMALAVGSGLFILGLFFGRTRD